MCSSEVEGRNWELGIWLADLTRSRAGSSPGNDMDVRPDGFLFSDCSREGETDVSGDVMDMMRGGYGKQMPL